MDALLDKKLLTRTIYGWRPEFVLNRCATTAQVKAFEERCDCQLPDEYKLWVQTVGDGGIGLYALDAANDSGSGVVEILCYPRPLGDWESLSAHEKVDKHPMISLCSGGCEIEYFLVLAGPLRGSMCFSYFVEFNNYCVDSMNTKEGTLLSFLDWFEERLDRHLSQPGTSTAF